MLRIWQRRSNISGGGIGVLALAWLDRKIERWAECTKQGGEAAIKRKEERSAKSGRKEVHREATRTTEI